MSRVILHVDMDAFFASVEQRDRPELRGKPVVVGGPSKRGVVCAASYEVRPYGVRSAMPMGEALRRCPQAIVVAPRREAYVAASEKVFEIFHRYTPLVEGLSLDEAFLDVTDSRSLFGDGASIAEEIRASIRKELSLTASAGVGPSKFVAKLASDMRKPDGLFLVPDDLGAFLGPLPIERMWGIGVKTAPRLHALGVRTFKDALACDRRSLRRALGEGMTEHLLALSRGEDPRVVEPDRAAKSVGAEETFEEDLRDAEAIELAILSQAERVGFRALREGCRGRTVTVKLKYADFTLETRQTTLPEAIWDTASLMDSARRLLPEFSRSKPVRLVGISLSGLEERAALSLFPDETRLRREKLQGTLLAIHDRFGSASVKRAALIEREESVGELDPRRRG